MRQPSFICVCVEELLKFCRIMRLLVCLVDQLRDGLIYEECDESYHDSLEKIEGNENCEKQ